MEKWKRIPIGDICTIERGGSPRPIDSYITNDTNGINWIKIGDTSDSMYITHTAQKIKPEGMKKSRYVQPGDFLLSNSMSFGHPYILKIDGCIHDGWLVIRDYNGLFDKQFLYYLLSSPVVYNKFKSMAVGGVVNNLNSEMVRKLIVPVPPISEQRIIANKLNKIVELISLRQQQLEKLDTLVKSQFIEMFAPYINDEKSACQKELKELSDMVTVGIANSATQAYSDEGIIMLRNQNIHENYLDSSDLIYITPDFASKYNTKALKKDDILVIRTGYPGIACLVPEEYEGCQTFTTLIVRLSKEIPIMPEFVCRYINSEYGKRYVMDNQAGCAQQNFGAKALGKMPIPMPPMAIQRHFVEITFLADKSKLSIQASLTKLETLKKSLMQEYFG